MANSQQVSSASDDALKQQRLGAVMQVLGWTLIAFDCIIGVWIWVGLRSGSFFWVWWVAIEGVLGLALIGLGTRRRSRGNRQFGELAPR